MERLTPKEKREKAEAFGVAIFILDDKNRVFTLQELEMDEKTGKVPRDFGVICEKRSDGHESWAANMWRAIQEETRIPDDQIVNVIDFPYPIPERIWEMPFTSKSWATVIVLRCHNPALFMALVEANRLPEANSVKKEVRPIGFLARGEFEKLNLRKGVRNIINSCGDEIFNHNK